MALTQVRSVFASWVWCLEFNGYCFLLFFFFTTHLDWETAAGHEECCRSALQLCRITATMRYTILSKEKVLVLDLSDRFYIPTSWYVHYSSWLGIMWQVMQHFMRSQGTNGMSNRETLDWGWRQYSSLARQQDRSDFTSEILLIHVASLKYKVFSPGLRIALDSITNQLHFSCDEPAS